MSFKTKHFKPIIGVMVGVKVEKKLQFDMTEPQSNLHHAYKKKNMYF